MSPHRTALAILALLSVSPFPLHAAPIKAAYCYGYMSPDHVDSLAAAGFNRALVKVIGDSLTARHRSELKGWLDRGRRVGVEIAPSWSIMASSRVSARPAERRYIWGGGTIENEIACPLDSVFWKSALIDRAVEIRRAFPEVTHLHVDLETYVGSRTHYNAGVCRCRPCLTEYTRAVAGVPPQDIPRLEDYEEDRLTRILTAELATLAAAYPDLEVTFFDLDLDSFVHRAMARALVAARVPTANFTERTYRLAGDAVAPARNDLERLGLEIPVVGGIYLQRFVPTSLPQAMQSVLERAEGCFIFTTYSLWQQPSKLTGPYILPGSQREYWSALREGFGQPDLEPSDIRVAPEPIRPGVASEARFTIYNRGRAAATTSRWVLTNDGVEIAEDDAPIPAGGSVAVAVMLGSDQAAGSHVFRVVLDALDQVNESNEGNNARARTVAALAPPPPPPPPGNSPSAPDRAFPSTPVLDNFNRSSGPLGASWTPTTGASVSSKRFKPTASAVTVIWKGSTPGPEQEAYVKFPDVSSSSPRQGLLLKVQGETVESGAIEVRYDAPRRLVLVATYTPGTGWEDRGTAIATRLTDDDVLGARTHANGDVEIYRNGVKLGTRSVAGWPHAGRGGRIGLSLYNATKTRLDDFGGGEIPLATAADPRPSGPVFPSTPVVDAFARADGALGGAWVGAIDGIIVSSGRFKPTTSRYVAAIWDGATPAANQEAYVKFLKVTSSSPRQGLLLKVQGRTVETGAIEVRFDAVQRKIFVATFTPGIGWEDRGAGIATRLYDDDVLGARAYANGQVEVYRNGVKLDTRSVAGWRFADQAGRIGITLLNASSTRLDDFGGGSCVESPGTEPGTGLRSQDPPAPSSGLGPAVLELGASAPNPFAKTMRVRFGLPRGGAARLAVYDVLGRHVTTLVQGRLEPGWHSVQWDGRGRHGEQMAAGVYVLLLESAGKTRARKAVLAR